MEFDTELTALLYFFFFEKGVFLLKRFILIAIIFVITLSMIPLQLFVANDAFAAGSSFYEEFNSHNSNWEYRTGPNGSPFNCIFLPSQVSFADSKMILTLDRDNTGSGYPYKGGEYRTTNFYGYGYYEVKMKAAKNTGIVSSFFTYTGPSDGNPWDEIDIEILGKDTYRAQFNWYTNGKGGHEYMYYLGFDASQDFHVYGFDWQPNSITYYVDGKKVYQSYQEIPRTPGKIMMNIWPGITVDEWLGPYDGRTPISAYYEYVRYSAEGYTPLSTPTPTRSNTPTHTPTNTPTPTRPNTPTPTTNPAAIGDFNGDRVINMADVIDLASRFNKVVGDPKYDRKYDLNNDGVINMADVIIIAQKFNTMY